MLPGLTVSSSTQSGAAGDRLDDRGRGRVGAAARRAAARRRGDARAHGDARRGMRPVSSSSAGVDRLRG